MPLRDLEVLQRHRRGADAGVVEQQVEPPEGVASRADSAATSAGSVTLAGTTSTAPAVRRQGGGLLQGPGAAGPPARPHTPRPGGPGPCEADAGAGARDDRDLRSGTHRVGTSKPGGGTSPAYRFLADDPGPAVLERRRAIAIGSTGAGGELAASRAPARPRRRVGSPGSRARSRAPAGSGRPPARSRARRGRAGSPTRLRSRERAARPRPPRGRPVSRCRSPASRPQTRGPQAELGIDAPCQGDQPLASLPLADGTRLGRRTLPADSWQCVGFITARWPGGSRDGGPDRPRNAAFAAEKASPSAPHRRPHPLGCPL